MISPVYSASTQGRTRRDHDKFTGDPAAGQRIIRNSSRGKRHGLVLDEPVTLAAQEILKPACRGNGPSCTPAQAAAFCYPAQASLAMPDPGDDFPGLISDPFFSQ